MNDISSPIIAAISLGVLMAACGWLAPDAHAEERVQTPEFNWVDPREGEVVRLERARFVETMLRENLNLEEARLRAERAQLDILAARGREDWQFTSDLSATYARSRTNTGISSGLNETLNIAWNNSFSRQFDTGTSLTFSLDTQIERSEFPLQIEDPDTGVTITQRIQRGPNFRETLSATVRQSLLRGRGIEVNEALENSARRAADLEMLALKQQAADLTTQAMTLFAALKYSENELELALEQRARANRQLTITEAQLNAGQIADYEAGLAEQRVASAQERVLAASLQLREQSRQIQTLIEQDPRGPIVLAEPYEPNFPEWELDRLCEDARINNLQVATVRAQREQAIYRQVAAENDARHQLDAFLTLGAEGFDSSFSGALESLATFESFTVAGGLQFTAAIGRTAARAALEQAQIELDTLDVLEARLDRRLCTQAASLLDEYHYQRERGQLTSFREERAHEALTAEERRFEGGRSTVQQILEAEERLEAIQSEKLQSRQRREELLWQLRSLILDFPDDLVPDLPGNVARRAWRQEPYEAPASVGDTPGGAGVAPVPEWTDTPGDPDDGGGPP
jgi:outer membrane protein TolC